MKNRKIYVAIIALLLIVFTVAGVSFAIFSYVRTGNTTTTIKSGDIEFTFNDGDSVTLENAFPISDSVGAVDTANAYKFDVNLSATSSAIVANYSISLVSNNDGTDHFTNSEVKYNLQKNGEYVIGSSSSGKLLSTIDGFDADAKSGIGVVLANQEISATNTDSYVLRIWVDEKVDYTGDVDSNGTMVGTKNNYTYSLRVKVDTTATNTLGYSQVSVDVDNKTITADISDEEGIVAYALKTTNEEPTEEEWIYLDDEGVALNKSNIKKMSTSKVTSKKIVIEIDSYNVYYLFVKNELENITVKTISILPPNVDFVSADSILDAIKNYNKSGYLAASVNGITYNIHVYNFDGDQHWDSTMNTTFGDIDDVGSSEGYASNMVAVKVNGDLTIDSDVTVSPYYTNYGGPKGFTLYVTGTLTNNGTIDNSHGAKAEGQNVYLWKNIDGNYEYIPAVGGSGGGSVYYKNGIAGKAGSTVGTRALGGGGSGGSGNNNTSSKSGIGTAATSYSGGTGGAGGIFGKTVQNATINGGMGGRGYGGSSSSQKSGTGAGNPAGSCATSSSYCALGSNGTGGLLIIYADTIIGSSTSSFTAVGAKGGNAYSGGGSSGGGSINIFYTSSYEHTGDSDVSGGTPTGTNKKGGAGGAGTTTIGSIATGTFVSN